MFEYKFVTIELKSGLRGSTPKEDYHAEIERHVAEGYRLVQIFAPPLGNYGAATYLELIFEKAKQGEYKRGLS
jgi:hypothetical protein